MFFLFLPKSSWSTTTGLIKNEDHLYTPNLIIFLFWTYLFIFRHIREMKRLHSFHLISFTSLSLTFLCLLKFRQVLPHYKQRTIQITFQVFQATSDKLTITKYPSLKLGKYHIMTFFKSFQESLDFSVTTGNQRKSSQLSKNSTQRHLSHFSNYNFNFCRFFAFSHQILPNLTQNFFRRFKKKNLEKY